MTSSANDNAPGGPMEAVPDIEFEGPAAEAAQAVDWAEELMLRPRRFAPNSRFRAEHTLIVALWWAAKRHAQPECFLGREDQLVVDMRPRRDAAGAYLTGRQLNAFLDHLTARAGGELRALVYLRPHPETPALSILQAAIDALGRGVRRI